MIHRSKRLMTGLLLVVALLGSFLCAALAENRTYFHQEEQIAYANACLTEVRGYTGEEAEQFVFEQSQQDGIATVRYWHPECPDWVYSIQFSLTNGQILTNDSPFHSDYQGYPGENSVRLIIRQVQEQGLLENWNKASREAFRAILQQDGLTLTAQLDKGLLNATYSPQEALKDFFVTCYGAPEQWPVAVESWYQQLLETYQLSDTEETAANEGVTRYRSSTDKPFVLTEFTNAPPPELAEVFRHPMLDGWQVLSGAMVVYEDHSIGDYGLVAFGSGGKRLLCIIHRGRAEETWQILPASKTLLPDGCIPVITRKDSLSEMGGREYVIRLDKADIENVREISLLIQLVISENGCYARLKECSFFDEAQGIHYQAKLINDLCTVYQTDRQAGRYDTVVLGGGYYTNRLTAIELTSLLEGILNPENATGFNLPQGSVMTGHVHLRKETSSHSRDLGMLNNGVIAENLGMEKGDPYPWYHVRIGGLEGYVSSVYVHETPGELLSGPVPVALAKETMFLRQQRSWFSSRVARVEKGTTMHIVLEHKGWYYVCVPQNQPAGDWMDPEGLFGYVRASQVTVGSNAEQLEWKQMESGE